MAVLRLASGSDVTVKLTVAEAVAALAITAGLDDFVEMPGDEGPVHIRPAGVIAVLDDTRRNRGAGFRVGAESA